VLLYIVPEAKIVPIIWKL